DSSKCSITLFDKQQKPLKTFSTSSREAADKLDINEGMNQFVWDMNHAPGERIDGMILWNGGVGSVKIAPGTYKARVKYNTDSVDVPFVVKA
ncbi:hypothetical protein, partial [Klebsiella pneumoniae]|uniref:hypothetical protein n=1 Tax=Klebsiella pneumoniae TaxID=573 RepID=UPI0013D507CE